MENALVVVIDDDDFILAQVCRVLAERFPVVSARSMEAGLQAVASSDPSVILCDESLPGFDLAAAMSLLRSACDHAAIVLMGEWTQEIEARARAGGADAFLPKPFLRSDLLALVNSLVAGAARKSLAA